MFTLRVIYTWRYGHAADAAAYDDADCRHATPQSICAIWQLSDARGAARRYAQCIRRLPRLPCRRDAAADDITSCRHARLLDESPVTGIMRRGAARNSRCYYADTITPSSPPPRL